MPTFKIALAYDGTDFVGWQRQAEGISIQGLLEGALRDLDERDVTVFGAGRTDAGVHARGQVASFALARSIDASALVRALNARLPHTVRIVAADLVPEAFHARFDATSKTYCYRIWNADVLDPFERRYTWHVAGPLDREAMAAAARAVEGRHDFAAFRSAGGAPRSTEREMFSSRLIAGLKPCATEGASAPAESGAALEGCGPLITYEVRGNGFLRHMVRTIAGTLIDIGRGRRSVESMRELLGARDRAEAGPTAPPEGLVLVTVEYPARLLAADR